MRIVIVIIRCWTRSGLAFVGDLFSVDGLSAEQWRDHRVKDEEDLSKLIKPLPVPRKEQHEAVGALLEDQEQGGETRPPRSTHEPWLLGSAYAEGVYVSAEMLAPFDADQADRDAEHGANNCLHHDGKVCKSHAIANPWLQIQSAQELPIFRVSVRAPHVPQEDEGELHSRELHSLVSQRLGPDGETIECGVRVGVHSSNGESETTLGGETRMKPPCHEEFPGLACEAAYMCHPAGRPETELGVKQDLHQDGLEEVMDFDCPANTKGNYVFVQLQSEGCGMTEVLDVPDPKSPDNKMIQTHGVQRRLEVLRVDVFRPAPAPEAACSPELALCVDAEGVPVDGVSCMTARKFLPPEGQAGDEMSGEVYACWQSTSECNEFANAHHEHNAPEPGIEAGGASAGHTLEISHCAAHKQPKCAAATEGDAHEKYACPFEDGECYMITGGVSGHSTKDERFCFKSEPRIGSGNMALAPCEAYSSYFYAHGADNKEPLECRKLERAATLDDGGAFMETTKTEGNKKLEP
ncbi:unnamed protein product, partial [Amoebophrya sp. A120]|eukprot:GSA120T00022613001.1